MNCLLGRWKAQCHISFLPIIIFIEFIFSKKFTKLENHVFDINSSGEKNLWDFFVQTPTIPFKFETP